LAEVGSGGSLAAAMSSAKGAAGVLAGAYFAPTMQRLYHLLDISEKHEPASKHIERVAEAAAVATASQCTVAVGEVRPDEGGPAYVEVVFRLPGGMTKRRIRMRGTGELARTRLSTQILDELRRRLK